MKRTTLSSGVIQPASISLTAAPGVAAPPGQPNLPSRDAHRASAFFAVPDLGYLRRGKKLSGLMSLVGMAMKVKPVMAVENGENEVKTKLFGEQKNMILAMLEMIRDDIAGRPLTLVILQTAAKVSVVRRLRDAFQSAFDCVEIFDACFSPAVGLNMGPEATGIAYYKHPRRA